MADRRPGRPERRRALPVERWGGAGGPRVLLVHGLTSSAATWSTVAERVAATGAEVVAPDLPGHGAAAQVGGFALRDMADDLLDVPIPGPAWDVVVGHSLGGVLAVLAGAARSGWTRALLLLDPVLALPRDRSAVLEGVLGELFDLDPLALQRDHPSWSPRDVVEKAHAARQVREATVRAILTQPIDWDFRALVPSAASTVSVLAADPAVEDPALPWADVERLRRRHVHAETVAGAGHSIHRDRPDVVLAEIARLLRSAQGGTSD